MPRYAVPLWIIALRKKRFLLFSYLATVATTAMLYFVEPGYVVLGLLLIVLSNYAYSMGESFIAAFLPELGPPDALGKISGFGWALGYIGGLVAAGFTLIVLGEATADNFERIRWVGPFAAGFFLVAAIPTFLWLKERGVPKPHGVSYRQIAQQRIVGTFKELRTFKDLSIFLVSLLFSMAGVYIIIAFAFIYGAQVIGWDESVRNIMFIIVQVTAAAGAIGFGFLQDKLGAKHTYQMTLALWVAAIVAIWATPRSDRMAQSAVGLAVASAACISNRGLPGWFELGLQPVGQPRAGGCFLAAGEVSRIFSASGGWPTSSPGC